MKFRFLSTILMTGVFASAANAMDASKYMTCFESLNRDKVSFDGLFVTSPKTVLIAAISGDKRGFYQISDQAQKLKWIADFRPEAPEVRDATQFFKVSPGNGLPLITIQTSYAINFSTMDRKQPTVHMWLAENNPIKQSSANLIEQDLSDSDVANLLNRKIAFTISNLASFYFPNTSLFSKLLGDTLAVAKAIENSQGRDTVYLTYGSREGGRDIPKESAVQMLNALKARSLEWASQYEQGQLAERGIEGFNGMITACSKVGSREINDAIQAEQRELNTFITRDIERVQSLR